MTRRNIAAKTGQEALRGVRAVLEYIGEDPEREGLRDTPGRVLRAWDEMCAGYDMDPGHILSRDFSAKYDEMICVPNVEFFSTCEHHMLPFAGVAHVAYIPGVKPCRVVGLSKLARLVDCFARRLQIQEQLTQQIADAIEEHLKPRGVAVVVNARHMCMSCRGARKQRASMITSAMRGAFRDPAARAEFLAFITTACLSTGRPQPTRWRSGLACIQGTSCPGSPLGKVVDSGHRRQSDLGNPAIVWRKA